MSHQRDPAVHPVVPAGQREDLALTLEHLADRSCPRLPVRIPPPRSERSADADPVETGEHAVRMGDRAGLDGERDAVADRLREAGRRRQFVVVGRVRGMDRNGPREDRSARSQVVGNRRADEPVAGEMLMCVDETRQHDPVRTTDPFRRCVPLAQGGSGTDVDDAPVVDGDGTVADHAARRVHRDHPLALDEEVHGDRPRRVSAVHCRYGTTVRP